MLEALKEFFLKNVAIADFNIPMWAIVAAGLGVLVLLIVIISCCSHKKVSRKEINFASQIIRDVQTSEKIANKEFAPPAPSYDKFAELPDPESTSEPIEDIVNRLLEKGTVVNHINELNVEDITNSNEENTEEPKAEEESALEDVKPEPIISADEELNFDDLNTEELDSGDTLPFTIEESDEDDVDKINIEDLPTEDEIKEAEATNTPVEEVAADNDAENNKEDSANVTPSYDNNLTEAAAVVAGAAVADALNDAKTEETKEEIVEESKDEYIKDEDIPLEDAPTLEAECEKKDEAVQEEPTPVEKAVPVAEEIPVEPIEEAPVEEVEINNTNIIEDAAVEEIIESDNIVEEVPPEEAIATPVIEEVKEEVVEETIVEETPIEEIPVEQPAPILEETPVEPIEEENKNDTQIAAAVAAGVVAGATVGAAMASNNDEEKAEVEEVVEEPENNPALHLNLTPAVPVIKPAAKPKAPIKKKANLVKAPVSRPTGSRPKKASAIKQQSTVKSTPAEKKDTTITITNFAPITKMDGDKEILIIKLFGDKIEPSKGKYVIANNEDNLIKPYRFELKANNGTTLFISSGYKIHPRARQIETFHKALANGVFNYDKAENDEFTFKLIAADGKVFGTGMTYPTIEGAEKAVESVKKFAEKANYIEDPIQ